jgi:hypothetical protein
MSVVYVSLGASTFTDGTVRGFVRFLVEFPLERYELYNHSTVYIRIALY